MNNEELATRSEVITNLNSTCMEIIRHTDAIRLFLMYSGDTAGIPEWTNKLNLILQKLKSDLDECQDRYAHLPLWGPDRFKD